MKKKNILLVIGLIVYVGIMIGVISYTYSYYTASATNTGVISGTVASYDLELSVSKVGNSGTGDLVPQLDSAITSAIKGTDGTLCLDGNGNTICQVYKIDVKNLSNSAVDVYGYLDLDAGSNPNLKWAEVSGVSNPSLLSSVNPYSTALLSNADTINASSTKTYYIVLWISETGTAQSDTGSFTGVVTFTLEERLTTAKQTLTKLGLTANSGTPDFDSVATTNEGIYKADDDLGTSYYFRGAVDNNWVYFAGIYWRIIRINGDGSIRMIYSGTTAPTSDQAVVMTGSETQVTTSKFSESFAYNKYLGYTYDNNGTETDSPIKDYIENTWYANTLLNTNYEQYLADAIYCNDRKASTNSTVYDGWASENYDVTSTTLGQGTTPTIYESEERLGNYATPRSPSLKCSQDSDKYTTSTSLGNGKLKYKVGLITADEVAMAGGRTHKFQDTYTNMSFYLYTNSEYWTLTPMRLNYYGYSTYCFAVNDYLTSGYTISVYGVRPVISITPTATILGNGTYSDPFTIS